jgi:hypothetical protein
MDAISIGSQTLGAVNIKMLKKTQDLVASQVMQLVQCLPQSPNGNGVGANIDVST